MPSKSERYSRSNILQEPLPLSTRHRISIATFTLAVVFSVPLSTASAQQKPPVSETTQIVDTIKALFTAISNDDLAKFNSLITPDFYMYDGGERFNPDSIIALIHAERAAGKHYEWNVTQTDVHISGDTAWIAYVNDGSVTDASGTLHRKWLESAFLKRDAGTWKIAFFHSTRVPPPQNHP
jgi:ketosteroid isomerase-like protein